MKIATWNVNSIRARAERAGAWLDRMRPDVVCLQETKVQDDVFPREIFESRGYALEVFGQKTYNGVAIASLLPLTDVSRGLPGEGDDAQKRLIEATVDGVRVVNIYVPNGSEPDCDKFLFKMDWLRRLSAHLADRHDPERDEVLLLGDFNIAPEDRDVYDPEAFRGKLLFHPDEHARLRELLEWGMVDVFRRHHEQAGLYSWWDYRAARFKRGQGLRIDLLLTTAPLAARCVASEIDRDERKGEKPSDHAPVIVDVKERSD
jgi:exodeoxyribonuclease III